MKMGVKVVIAGALVVAAASVAAFEPVNYVRGSADLAGAVAKDQSRLPSADGATSIAAHADYGALLTQLAQAVRLSGQADATREPATPSSHLALWNAPPGPPPMRFAAEGRQPEPLLAGIALDRDTCEDGIARSAGLMGYLKSRLQLTGSQAEAWQKLEAAAEPVIDEMQKVCVTLPRWSAGPPRLSDMIEGAEKQFTLRAKLVSAVAAPARHLYEILSPEQRAIFNGPPPLP
jgi:hypothetical protein